MIHHRKRLSLRWGLQIQFTVNSFIISQILSETAKLISPCHSGSFSNPFQLATLVTKSIICGNESNPFINVNTSVIPSLILHDSQGYISIFSSVFTELKSFNLESCSKLLQDICPKLQCAERNKILQLETNQFNGPG